MGNVSLNVTFLPHNFLSSLFKGTMAQKTNKNKKEGGMMNTMAASKIAYSLE